MRLKASRNPDAFLFSVADAPNEGNHFGDKKGVETCRSDGGGYYRDMLIPLELGSRGIFV
jgi:hypothetical protein